MPKPTKPQRYPKGEPGAEKRKPGRPRTGLKRPERISIWVTAEEREAFDSLGSAAVIAFIREKSGIDNKVSR
jgi:hypothetical protein